MKFEEEVEMTPAEQERGWAIRMAKDTDDTAAILYQSKTGPDDGVWRAALLCFLPDERDALMNLQETIVDYLK